MQFKRVLLKLSGEVLGGASGTGLDPEALSRVAKEIKEATETKTEIAIVVGGGNFFRGLSEKGHAMNRVSAELFFRADGSIVPKRLLIDGEPF